MLDMLNKKRLATLDEIHFKKTQIDKLNYLRHKIKLNLMIVESGLYMKKFLAFTLIYTAMFFNGINCFATNNNKTLNYKEDINMTEIETMIDNYGDEYIDKNLDKKTQQLLILATLTTTTAYPQIKTQTVTALDAGLTPEEIQEAIYHTAPYCGYTKATNAINAVNEVLKDKKIELPKSQATVTDEIRYKKGLEVQRSIFGPKIGTITDDMSDDQKVITRYLSEICFGDFYTRGTLDVKQRELITLSVLTANGGCEAQIAAHTNGNLSVGNTKDDILSAILLCVPYNGFPRTLNAINAVKSALPKE